MRNLNTQLLRKLFSQFIYITFASMLTVAATASNLPTSSLGTNSTIIPAIQLLLLDDEPASAAVETDLIISEYGEGSSNNKYIEIYNGTGADVDLSNYVVRQVTNGGTGSTADIPLAGMLANGQTLIVRNSNSSINAAISGAGDINIASGSLNHNGNDALFLVKNGTIIDVIGVDTDDPGSGWAVAGTANGTLDHVLVRKPNVCSPSTDWAASAGTDAATSQWIVLSNDVWSNIGAHTQTCTV